MGVQMQISESGRTAWESPSGRLLDRDVPRHDHRCLWRPSQSSVSIVLQDASLYWGACDGH
jgi:hypothetical protein